MISLHICGWIIEVVSGIYIFMNVYSFIMLINSVIYTTNGKIEINFILCPKINPKTSWIEVVTNFGQELVVAFYR